SVTALTKLTKANSDNPIWSPDGTKVAFQSERGLDGLDDLNVNGTVNIWIVTTDGFATPGFLTELKQADSVNPSWSADGTAIFCDSSRNLDGSDTPNVSSTTGFVSNTHNIWILKNVGPSGALASHLTNNTVAGADSFRARQR